MEKLLNLLFNRGETFCVSPNKLGYHSIHSDEFWNGEFKLIPPEDAYDPTPMWSTAKDIQLVALNPINGLRRDENVTAFRSFLVELDDGSLKDQYEYSTNDLNLAYRTHIDLNTIPPYNKAKNAIDKAQKLITKCKSHIFNN